LVPHFCCILRPEWGLAHSFSPVFLGVFVWVWIRPSNFVKFVIDADADITLTTAGLFPYPYYLVSFGRDFNFMNIHAVQI
jgi:hypothetical protein